MRKGLLLAFSAFLFALIAYIAHLWLSVLEGFPANFSPIISSKLPSIRAENDKPIAKQVFFILFEEEISFSGNGAYFQVVWPEVPGYYTHYVMLITGAPPELVGVYFEPRPIKANNLLEEMARSGLRVAFSGPYWWKELLGPSVKDLYASFFALPDRYPEIFSEGKRFASLFSPDFLFLHIPSGGDALEGNPEALGFDASQDILVVLTPSSFIVAGNGVIPGNYGPISFLDIASTLGVLSGSPVPAAKGIPLLHAFLLSDELKALKLASVAHQRVQLADFYLKKLIGRSLDEGIKSDAALILNSLELGNIYAVLELAKLTLEEANEAIVRARASTIIAGKWRRLPLFLLWALVPPLLLTLRRKPSAWLLIMAGLLSFTMNAWLFRQEWHSFSWEALLRSDLSLSAIKRTFLSLYVPALLPLLWLLLEMEEDAIEAGETLARYGLWTLYFTSLPVALSFLMIGAVPVYFFPSLGFYAAEFMGLQQLFLSGLLALPLPFVGMGLFLPLKLIAFMMHRSETN
ncbi:MAG: hypothetical protein RMK30_05065 [Anaerolineae bacterium]|nr:hypothetical protein [Anaerolineae bacterium]MDW8102227.1 hypothetical protein [Anaerolineae bacterium]